MSDGQETLAAITSSIADLQRRERELQGALEDANTERTTLVERRLKAIRELAEVRARNALADGVIDQSDRLSNRVASLLQVRAKTIAGLAIRHHQAIAARHERLDQHAVLAQEIDTLEARLDATAQAIRDNAASNPAHMAAVAKLEDAEATLERARAKAKQAHEDKDEKGRPYEYDPLFMYLWKRKYGSADYRSNGLIRWLDGLVARHIRYHDARANYSVLLQIPDRLDAHVARLQEIAKAAAAAVDDMEAGLIGEAAGADLIGALEGAREKHAAESAELERLGDEITDVSSQLNYYAEGKDHAFREVVDLTAGFLEEESLDRLQRVARSTPTPSDDQIVDRIGKIDNDIERLREKVEDDREELERLFKRKSELMRIEAEFRRRQYDDPASIFVPKGAGQILLRELLRGAIDAAEYWARTRSSHRRQSRPGDSYRRKSKSWPIGDMDFDWDDIVGDWDADDFFTDDRF
jgi:DNA repair exonuclease SbcCD ATPase subunit